MRFQLESNESSVNLDETRTKNIENRETDFSAGKKLNNRVKELKSDKERFAQKSKDSSLYFLCETIVSLLVTHRDQ